MLTFISLVPCKAELEDSNFLTVLFFWARLTGALQLY